MNEFEEAARRQKVAVIVDWLDDNYPTMTTADLVAKSMDWWTGIVAFGAKINPPSEATVQAVIADWNGTSNIPVISPGSEAEVLPERTAAAALARRPNLRVVSDPPNVLAAEGLSHEWAVVDVLYQSSTTVVVPSSLLGEEKDAAFGRVVEAWLGRPVSIIDAQHVADVTAPGA